MKDVSTDAIESAVTGGGADENAVLAATRELLWIETATDARAAAIALVEELGGGVVAAVDAGTDALPADVSFGEGEPLLPTAPSASVAHMLLTRHGRHVPRNGPRRGSGRCRTYRGRPARCGNPRRSGHR